MSNDIIVVTSTYQRKGRMEMMSHLYGILNRRVDVKWIVVEDGSKKDEHLSSLLPNFATYLNFGPTRDFGHAQRNLAFEYIHDNKMKGIVYNADDDNWYNPLLFDEIKKTKRISVFPVGNLGPSGVERPIVKDGKFVKWHAGWMSRKFPVDMAGFAFRSELLGEIKRPFWIHKGRGGESEFISKFVKNPQELEFLCNQCTMLFVKHNELLKKSFQKIRLGQIKELM